MKSILTHIGEDGGLETRMQAALKVARATNGHVTGIYAKPIGRIIGINVLGGSLAPQCIFDAFGQIEARTRSRVERRLSREGADWTYLSLVDQLSSALVAYGAINDLIVLSRSSEIGRRAENRAMIADILTRAHAPVLVMPEETNGFDVQGAAAMAWNGSVSASNALRAALPLLRLAKSVTLISIDGDWHGRFPQNAASEFLTRHEVKSKLFIRPIGSVPVEEALISAAGAHEIDYLVMGGFGHRRLRGFGFGGITRSILQDAPLPIVVGR